MRTLEEQLTVLNPNGVHSRVATKLIKIAEEHDVMFSIKHGGHMYVCSSVLDVLGIALTCGATFKVRAAGREPEKAVLEIKKLISEREGS